MTDETFLRRLRALIGRECSYLGKHCRVIEVLAEQGTLVLELREALPPIQTDQYGQAVARSAELVEVPLFAGTGDELSEELLDLLATLRTATPSGDGR
ncbi:MAG: hypothetical protein MUC77_13460 [Chromatiaceae bacterium]|nr:hypothetical protein [Chromatiaceae bacterium]